MQRELAGFAEFAAADRQHAVADIEVVAVERDRLADSHAGDHQHADQRLIRCDPMRGAQRCGGGDQGRHLLVGVEIRRRSSGATAQQVRRGHFGRRIEGVQMGREATHDAETLTGPAARRRSRGQGGPRQRGVGA
jgi:hypothetical protein